MDSHSTECFLLLLTLECSGITKGECNHEKVNLKLILKSEINRYNLMHSEEEDTHVSNEVQI